MGYEMQSNTLKAGSIAVIRRKGRDLMDIALKSDRVLFLKLDPGNI